MNPRDFLAQSTATLQAKLRAEARALAEVPIAEVSAEEFLEGKDWCGLPISRAQRTIPRLAEGLPITHLDPFELEYHCGARVLPPPTVRPRTVYLRSGRRSGKSLIAGVLGLVRAALTLRLRREPIGDEQPERDGLVGPSPGEPVLAPIVAPRLEDQALKTLNQILQRVADSPKLRKYIVNQKGHEFSLRRDDGQIVTVKALAASPRGTNVRGGWACGALLNEADFFGEKDATITLEDQIKAIQPSLVLGGQIWVESSPWDDSGAF